MGVKTLDRLAILAAMLLVAGLSVILIHRYQVSRIKQSLLVRAAQAEKDGSFGQASESYQEYLCLAPDDQDVRLKFAGVLLKGPKSARQEWAAYIFEQSLMRSPSLGDVRRRLAELRVGMGRYDLARPHLQILLKFEKEDGDLCFLLGRCQEEMKEPACALESYATAIRLGTSRQQEAKARQAALLGALQGGS